MQAAYSEDDFEQRHQDMADQMDGKPLVERDTEDEDEVICPFCSHGVMEQIGSLPTMRCEACGLEL
jgi:DNA-directed RNA polymerase subunit RPC12/RpoP